MKINTILLILLTGILLFGSTVHAQEDVGVSTVLSPPDTIVLDSDYALKAAVFNLGSQSSTFDVIITIELSGSGTYDVVDTVSVTDLQNGAIDTVEFSSIFTPTTEGSYDVVCYTNLENDDDPSNDSYTKQIETHWGVVIWYGNITGTPIEVNINSRLAVDAYVQTNSDVEAADCHICLGFDMSYIDSILTQTEGSWYEPLTEWDVAEFYDPQYGEPGMPEGFASQSFQGYSNISPPYDAPYLNSLVPIRVLSFVVKTANDSSVIGETAAAFVKGYNRIQGPSNASDPSGGTTYPIYEQHTPIYFKGAGKVRGTVIDNNSDPLENVEVVDLNSSRTTYTASDGTYMIENLFPGLHDISFSHPSQRDTTVTGVNILPNGTRTLNVQMSELPYDDVGVIEILSPPAFVQQNADYNLTSVVANMGTATSTFDVYFEAYVQGATTPLLVDTFTVVDMVGGTRDTITFDQMINTALDTTYEFVSYTDLAADVDNSNDTSYASSSIFFGVNAWYGSIETDPIPANIGDRLPVDVYLETVENIYLSFIHLCLGAENRYIDSLLGKTEGELYYPFTEWDIAQFASPQTTPPNVDGWSSQSFIGFSSIGSERNPWLHFEVPTKIMTFMTKVADDPLLVGDTVQCFGQGVNSTFGSSSASDTMVINSYPIVEIFSPIYFKAVGFITGTVLDVADDPIEGVSVTAIGSGIEDSTDVYGAYSLDSVTVGIYDVLFSHPVYRDTIVSDVEVRLRETTVLDMVLWFPCEYTPGDVTSDGLVAGGDVTYLVSYLRGIGDPPPDSCFNTNTSTWLYSAAEVSGDCVVTGGDVTVLINYFRGLGTLSFCPFTPPPSSTIQSITGQSIETLINETDQSISLDMEDKR